MPLKKSLVVSEFTTYLVSNVAHYMIPINRFSLLDFILNSICTNIEIKLIYQNHVSNDIH